MSAMIVGVCTDPEYRRRGYTSTIMTKLCYDLQQEGKGACLFYDNPSAGTIYQRLGFVTIGKWSMIDVFVVAILVALVHLGGILVIRPGAAALAFAGVVIVTIFAAESFDPRLLWDQQENDGE